MSHRCLSSSESSHNLTVVHSSCPVYNSKVIYGSKGGFKGPGVWGVTRPFPGRDSSLSLPQDDSMLANVSSLFSSSRARAFGGRRPWQDWGVRQREDTSLGLGWVEGNQNGCKMGSGLGPPAPVVPPLAPGACTCAAALSDTCGVLSIEVHVVSSPFLSCIVFHFALYSLCWFNWYCIQLYLSCVDFEVVHSLWGSHPVVELLLEVLRGLYSVGGRVLSWIHISSLLLFSEIL